MVSNISKHMMYISQTIGYMTDQTKAHPKILQSVEVTDISSIFTLPIELLKSGFIANVKWREEPSFGMWHHIRTC